MFVRLRRANKDNLDPVFEAFQTLKSIVEHADEVEYKIGEDDDGTEYFDTMLLLPGSGEKFDPYDANVLNGLESWLAAEFAKRLEEE